MDAQTVVTAYGVWIEQAGWLRGDSGQAFAAVDRAVAEAAAELWGAGAQVLPIDDSLIDLQPKFLAQQAARAASAPPKGIRAWLTTKR